MSDSLANRMDDSQWSLFGYDVRSLGRLWVSAWRDFLFSTSSPIRARLDEPVRLHGADETLVFQGGEPLADARDTDCRCHALEVPESLFLARTLTVPAAAEAELASVLAMEIAANSPFAAEDTVSGWRELSRTPETLSITFAVASRSALRQWLSDTDLDIESAPPELWVTHEGAWITLQGYSEVERDKLYRARLLRVGGFFAAMLIALYVITGLYVAQQRLALERLEGLQRSVTAEAAPAAAHRESLLTANEAIAAANKLLLGFPNPHVELARLTQLLDDDAYLAHFSMRGRALRLRGRATDAALVMQDLSEQSAFASVTAPQAITAVGNTGVEQFYLDIELADDSVETEP